MNNRKRKKQIVLRATEEELEKIQKNVEKSKLTQQQYLLKIALNKEVIVIDDIKEMMVELKRIGNNINQIARIANTEGKIEDLTNIQEDLKEAWKEVSKALKKVNK